MSGPKYSFDRPPGSVDEYGVNLEKLLGYVQNESPSKDDLVNWMVEEMGDLSSKQSAKQKLPHFRHLGVISENSNQFDITQRGRKALDGNSQEVFFDCLIETYKGFDTILQELAEGPKKPTELQTALDASSPDNWMSSDQHKRRLDWLRSLDIVIAWENETGYYVLTDEGSQLAQKRGILEFSHDDWQADLYLVSACKDDVRRNFDHSVVSGVNPGAIGIDSDKDSLPVWGREDIRLADDPEAGDWLIFYQSGRRRMFTYAAQLRSEPIVNGDIGQWIWGGDYKYIYPLKSLTPIDIDSGWLMEETRGYGRTHVQGMEKLGEGKCRGRYRLRYLYESVAEFIAAHAKPQYAELRRQLRTDGQVVMYGPPGTGKTYTAKKFADWWYATSPDRGKEEDVFDTTTFHPAYSYEDFIEGLKAESTTDGVTYDYEPGVFKKIVEKAEKARDEPGDRVPPHLLLIDEINRGNIPQIFGELVTQLEWDKREGQPGAVPTSLAHSGETDFTVPSNLYLIGTMNTADRSIALLDAAIRRRFGFLRLDTDIQFVANRMGYGNFTGEGDSWAVDARDHLKNDVSRERRLRAVTVLAVKKINDRLLRHTDVPRGKRIGHTYIIDGKRGEGQLGAEELADRWRHKLFPLLEEYFYNDYKTLRETVFENTTSLFDQEIRSFDSLSTADLTEALVEFIDQYESEQSA